MTRITRRFGRAVSAALTVSAAVVLAVPSNPVVAQDDSLPFASDWDEARTTELEQLFGSLTCPEVTGSTFDGIDYNSTTMSSGLLADGSRIDMLRVADLIFVECTYRDNETSQQRSFKLQFDLQGAWGRGNCDAEPAEGSNSRIDLGNVTPFFSISAQITAQNAPVAVMDQLEQRARETALLLRPFARGCPPEPVPVTCPTIVGFVAGDVRIDIAASAPDTYKASCFYEPTDSAAEPRVTVDVQVTWVPPRATSAARLASACATETTFDRGWGTIGGNGLAIRAVYGIASFDPIDTVPIETAVEDIIDQVSEQADSCENVDFLPRSEQFTPVPALYAEAFAPEHLTGVAPPLASEVEASAAQQPPATPVPAPPSTVAATADTTEQPVAPADTTPPADTADTQEQDQPAAPPTAQDDSEPGGLTGVLAVVLPIVTIVLLVISLIGLALAFLLIRRETRVRPKIDIARLVIILITATAMMLIFSKGAPLWAIVLAVVAGSVLGYVQGNHLTVRLTEAGLMAKRTAWAIAAFAASLVLSQIAGLLNRTGAIAIGIALSFLSAALTAGLIVGRRPRMIEARAATTAAIIVMLIVAPFGPGGVDTDTAGAQDDGLSGSPDELDFGAVLPEQRTAANNTLIDAVNWDQIEITGGLWWDQGKPFTPAPIPRALDGVPEPITRTVEWASSFGNSENPDILQVTETFEFRLRTDGWCCSIGYTATGTRTRTNGETEQWSVDGTLDDIQSVAIEGGGAFHSGTRGGQPFTEVREFDAPGDADDDTVCRRIVGATRATRLLERYEGEADLTIRVDGTEQEFGVNTALAFGAPCDLPTLSMQGALDAAPPPPAGDDESRRGCPVLQETIAALSEGTTFEGFDTATLAEVLLTPNDPTCQYGALVAMPAIGQGGPGNTRMEFAIDVAMPRQGEWDPGYSRWGARDNQVWAFGPSDVNERERCDFEPDGTLIEPQPGRTCQAFSLHRIELPGPTGFRQAEPSFGWMQIWTQYNLADGPNTEFYTAFPWASSLVRCHHCSPFDQEIVDFMTRVNDFYGQGWGQFGDAPPPPQSPAADSADDLEADDQTDQTATDQTADEPTTSIDPDVEAAVEEEVEGLLAEDDEQTREAALVAIMSVLAAAGLLGTSLAEVGLSMPELVDAWRRGGRAEIEATVSARVAAHEMVFGADEDASVGGDELYGGEPDAPAGEPLAPDGPPEPLEPQVVRSSPEATVQAQGQPDGTVVFETLDAEGNVIGTEVVNPATGTVIVTTGTPYAASNWTSERAIAARDAAEAAASRNSDSTATAQAGVDGLVTGAGQGAALGDTTDTTDAGRIDTVDGDTAEIDGEIDNLLDQPNPDAHLGDFPEGAPPVDPDLVRNPPDGPLTPEALDAARRVGADGRGRITDQYGNHIATIGPDGVARNGDGNPVAVVWTEGAGVVGWNDGTRTIEYDTNGIPHEANRTWATDQTTQVQVWQDVTRDADGNILDSEGRVIGRELPDRSVVDIYDQPMDVRGEGGEIAQVRETVDVHDPRGQVVVERAPAPDAPRITDHRPTDLSSDVRSRWTAHGAGPNGELYGTDGQVIGQIDTNGVVTIDGVVQAGVRVEAGRVVEAWTADGQRISGDGTAMDPLVRTPPDPDGTLSDLPDNVVRGEDGWRVDGEPRVVVDSDLSDMATGQAPRHPDAPPLPSDDAATVPGDDAPTPGADAPESRIAGDTSAGDTTITDGDTTTPTGDTTITDGDTTTPTGDTTITDGDTTTPTGDTTITDGDTRINTGDADGTVVTADAGDGTRVTTAAGGFTDGRTRFDNFLGNKNVDRIGKMAQLTALTEQYEREGLSFEEAAARAAVETWGADVVGEIISGEHGVTAPGISMVGGAFLPPRLRGLMPDQFAGEILRDGMRLGDAMTSDDPAAVDQAWEAIRNDPNGSVIRGIAEAGFEAGDYFSDETQASVTAADLYEATIANLDQFGQDAQTGEYGTVLRGVAEMATLAGELSAGDPATYDRLLRDFDTLWEHANWQISDNTVQAVQQTPIVGDVVTLAQNAPGFAASAQEAFSNWWNS